MIRSWFTNKKQPQAATPTVVTPPPDVRPAPVDPTLENAAREIALSVAEKARIIRSLSEDVLAMTEGLISQFKDAPDAQPHKKPHQ